VAESIWEFLKLMDEKFREDKIFFLAGGVAFNLLLALIPLLVITITAMGLLLGRTPTESTASLVEFLSGLVPVSAETAEILRGRLSEALQNVTTAVSVGTIAFIWLSTRLFGSLRAVLADVFDIEDTRNLITGKLFDIRMTLISSLFLMSYIAVTTYIAVVKTQERVARERSIFTEEMISSVEEWAGRALAFALIMFTFFVLYRYLPRKRVRWRTATAAALFSAVMLEIARYVFGVTAPSMNPGNLYGAVLASIILAIAWSYYVALIFIVGGEVSQVYDLRRARKIQRVVFE
jgi:membrane protein